MAETPTIPQKYQNLKTQLASLIGKETTTKEDKSNKVTSISSSSTDTQYPSAKLLYDKLATKANSTHYHSASQVSDSEIYPNIGNDGSTQWEINQAIDGTLGGKEDKSNKVTSISSSSTDTQYPSAKCVYDGLQNTIETIVDMVYPVGSIYMSVNSTSPATLFGGTWEQLQNRFLIGAGGTYSNGATGGATTHTLTISEMPSHTHTQNAHSHTIGSLARYTINGNANAAVGNGYGNTQDYGTSSTTATNKNTGGGGSHNNMPPYLAVYMWKRTA